MPTHAERMLALFDGSDEGHGTHGAPRQASDSLKWEIKSTAETVRKRVTVEHWELHIKGKRPLGIITIRKDGMVKWAGIDYDVYDSNLLSLIMRVEAAKLPFVPCRSKSGGLHLFIFFKDWMPAVDVRNALTDIAAKLGIAGSEIFPKQTKIMSDRGEVGNWMVMPYFGDTYGGKIFEQVGLKKTGATMTIDEFLQTAEAMAVDADGLAKLVRKRMPRQVQIEQSDAGTGPIDLPEPTVPFGDGPPCLETLAAHTVAAGGQNSTLLMMGIYYKRRYPTEWQAKLEAAAHTYLDPPGSSEGTAQTIRQLEKKDYFYTCRTEPMKSYCNPALCRTRPCGVGEAGDYPCIVNISKLESDPPTWFVDFEGAHIEVNTDQLHNYTLFQKVCMEFGNRVYRQMSQKDWVEVLRAAFLNLTAIVLPRDAGDRGKFEEVIEDFCTNRQKGEAVDDLLNGRPWFNEEDQKHYFRLKDLEDFMRRAEMRNWTRGRVISRIMEMDGNKAFFNIKGRGTRCWFVPASSIQVMPDADTPKRKESPI